MKRASRLASLLVMMASLCALDHEPRIDWQPDVRVKRCERIFPDPHDPFRVWVCTAQGIVETSDDGATWRTLPNTGAEQLGRISDVLHAPSRAGVILIATRDRGIFRSDDDGVTWRSNGTTGSGLAALQVVRLGTPPFDRSGRIFYAAHGDAAPGISKTIDGGTTWFTVAGHLFSEDLLLDGQEILVTGHSAKEQDLWSVYQSDDCAGSWLETMRDVRPTACGTSRSTISAIWLGALKGRILHRSPAGAHKATAAWTAVGPDQASWASIFGTPGSDPAHDTLFAYDPRALGLIASNDGFATWRSENSGLFVGRLVKEGANVCATANGRSFYAAINGQLYVGRTAPDEGPVLARFRVSPRVVRIATAAKAVFSATVRPMDATPDAKVMAVQVQLDGFRLPLLDDGAHDDGDAGDGVFAAAVDLKEDFLRRDWRPEFRWRVPGQVLLHVSATDATNLRSVGTLPMTVLPRPATTIFWDGEGARWGGRLAHARRGAPDGKFDSRAGIIFDIDAEAHSGARCLHVVAWKGPWLTGWGLDYYGRNLTDQDVLVFWIKATSRTSRDLQVLLTDAPGHENDARPSEAVWLIKDGFLSELTETYQQVRIPMTRFLTRSGFNLEMCNGIAFGGSDANGHNVFVDDIAFECSPVP
ncbi:MAG: hypothetical protein H0V44_17855 [Planctomycetes bacterium]|nr:hypothetical protein [Planctomycetota bacterium]